MRITDYGNEEYSLRSTPMFLLQMAFTVMRASEGILAAKYRTHKSSFPVRVVRLLVRLQVGPPIKD